MNVRRTLIALAGAALVGSGVAAAAGVGVALVGEGTDRPFAIAVACSVLFGVAAASAALAVYLIDRRRTVRRSDQRGDIAALRASVEKLGRSVELLTTRPSVSAAALERRLSDMSFKLYRQLEARSMIDQLLRPTEPLPPMRGYALSPDAALMLVERILRGRVRQILETGSGVSTLVCALALRQCGEPGRVVAIEHDPFYQRQTNELLDRYGCADIAQAVLAPLVPHEVDGSVYDWYDLSGVELPTSVDLLLVDGPPASVGPQSRLPALPLLGHTLGDGARVILDDADRPDERKIVECWVQRWGAELVELHRHEKGSAELRLTTSCAEPHARLADNEPVDGAEDTEPKFGATPDTPGVARRLAASELPESVWREPGGERSSYRYKLHESKRQKRLLQLLGHRQRVWAFNDKLSGYRLAQSLGVSVPETFIRSTRMTEVDWPSLPERFAIKPHNGTANRGVFLLERTHGSDFKDVMDGCAKSADAVMARYVELVAQGLVSDAFSVEELLAPRAELRPRIDIPDDFKIYCFYDRPVVTMQRRLHGTYDASRWRFKMWTADWEDYGPVKYADRYSADLEVPTGGAALLATAQRIAGALAIPFVRLDLYDTDRGPVFGEVSVHPGPPEIWDPVIDEMLGWEWEMAEARLLADRRIASEPID